MELMWLQTLCERPYLVTFQIYCLYRKMTEGEDIHVALAFVISNAVTNTDICNAFALEGKDKVNASWIIRNTMDANLIKPVDLSIASRYMKYIRYWA